MELREHLRVSGTTQAEIAEKVGTCQPFISKLCLEKQEASLPLALRIQWESGGRVLARDLPISDETYATLRLMRKIVDAGQRF